MRVGPYIHGEDACCATRWSHLPQIYSANFEMHGFVVRIQLHSAIALLSR